MSTITKPFTFTAGSTIIASEHNSNLDTIYNDYNGSIKNVNVAADALIAASKINLTTIAQAIATTGTFTMSSAILKQAKGADVASVAGAITLGEDGNYFDITGTNAITSITAKAAGTVVTLQFDSTASLVDGSNLTISGNFQGAAEAQIVLVSDGTSWFEIARNTNYTATTSNALSGSVIQTLNQLVTTPVDLTSVYNSDDTAPLYSEGQAITSKEITPSNASNLILIRAYVWGSPSGANDAMFWINDATGSDEALAVTKGQPGGGGGANFYLETYVSAVNITARTYYLVGATSSGTFYVGRSNSGADLFGAANFGSLTIQEIKA